MLSMIWQTLFILASHAFYLDANFVVTFVCLSFVLWTFYDEVFCNQAFCREKCTACIAWSPFYITSTLSTNNKVAKLGKIEQKFTDNRPNLHPDQVVCCTLLHCDLFGEVKKISLINIQKMPPGIVQTTLLLKNSTEKVDTFEFMKQMMRHFPAGLCASKMNIMHLSQIISNYIFSEFGNLFFQ